MPSAALNRWQARAAKDLDEVEGAPSAVGGTGPGGRDATRPLNDAYVVLLASQFQRFCRDEKPQWPTQSKLAFLERPTHDPYNPAP